MTAFMWEKMTQTARVIVGSHPVIEVIEARAFGQFAIAVGGDIREPFYTDLETAKRHAEQIAIKQEGEDGWGE